MWTRVGRFLLVPPFERLPGVPTGRVLPLLPLNGAWLALEHNASLALTHCSGLLAATPDGVDPLCVLCRHCLTCLASDRVNKGFSPHAGRVLGWTDDDIAAVVATLEIPYLLAWPTGAWTAREPALDLAFSFDRDHLIGGVDRLLSAHFPTLMERPGMAWFTKRRLRLDADDPAVRARFRERVLAVKARLEAVGAEELRRAIGGFGI